MEDDPRAVAARENLDMLVPKANELFIDLDDDAAVECYYAMLEVAKENGFELTEQKLTTSKGGNTHAYVTLPEGFDLNPIGRIALQAILGSDRKRELLSLLRVVFKTDRPPTVFFEVPSVEDDIPF